MRRKRSYGYCAWRLVSVSVVREGETRGKERGMCKGEAEIGRVIGHMLFRLVSQLEI
jgi:hypothetical protein